MERLQKYLQVAAVFVALLAPWVYFLGYAYQWGYLDSFEIERQMFFTAPQEYFGLAYLVVINVAEKILNAIPEGLPAVIGLAFSTFVVTSLAVAHWLRHSRMWPRLYHRSSGWLLSKRGLITGRFAINVPALAYIGITVPVMAVAACLYLFLLLASPGLIGYSQGQEEARKLRAFWHPNSCSPKGARVGCTEVTEAGTGKVIATGRLVAASDKSAAIFDGTAVTIYSMRNRDLHTFLTVPPASRRVQ